ncbi:hypothetical protein HS1genome_1843 [Sulfodiicoccus acidiphilus]|uniref:Uncharacterized protein n=1 Tax=Sulfodiicoccus acidiphilus TaxID=1670455 RepID=A0A348B5K2_9CREN|nr:hypothetical protein [Sulfodiicoccus acidiphilus]BBD73454.1 hypothetical protein HS1genome_1843 [Sulfodiicoccus acidiphilus]GGT92994.1 hypothetical protein GCM10007116_08530 [Sulfodiicoccus acidiphilus]
MELTPEDYHAKLVFADGKMDREFIRSVLKRNLGRHCSVRLFVPDPNFDAHVVSGGKGLEGVIRFVKSDLDRGERTFIVFVDKEHLTSTVEASVGSMMRKYGMEPVSSERIRDSVLGIKGRVGNKEFSMYVVVTGLWCCIEDEILSVLVDGVEGKSGEGCCDYYKEKSRENGMDPKRSWSNARVSEHFFNKIASILERLTANTP